MMKYGQRFAETSVPGWSLYNIDYDSLKHQIKTHTSKHQATAITIPGYENHALAKFETAFYDELCDQHDRVHLFVTSKADEISRRLRHISGLYDRMVLRCPDSRPFSPKRQRKLSKYQLEVDECGRDIKALRRFVTAQAIAFRKILKKYKKWTGSTTLGPRFNEDVLNSPKSFTMRDFHPLQSQYQDVLVTILAAHPTPAPTTDEAPLTTVSRSLTPPSPDSRDGRDSRPTSQTSTVVAPTTYKHHPTAATGYWNEYEHGSGDEEGSYAIYVDPDASSEFPGFQYVKSIFSQPVGTMRRWLRSRSSSSSSSTHEPRSSSASPAGETRSLLDRHRNGPEDYFSIHQQRGGGNTTATDNDATEDENYSYSSSDSIHHHPFSADPENDKFLSQYRDAMLTRGVVLAFAASFVLLLVSAILVATGRHKMRLEVDAGVTVGSVSSLFCGCMGLAAMLYRRDPVGWLYAASVWMAFVCVCILNGMLLVLVVGSSSGL
ncbi:hypothetical protein F4778DRAFT_723406 [Xylariomycetidae sp. FL2044]|nr:hypothetical protein F4778DRAFT_723406 [Xylariomycetidae sp. FL2044]